MKPISNKMGAAKSMSPFVWVFLIVLVFVGAILYVVNVNSKQLTTTGATPTQVGANGQATLACPQNPSVGYNGRDSLVTTTNATPTTLTYLVNGVYSASIPTPASGDKWQVLGDRSGYLADYHKPNPQSIVCGPQTLQYELSAYANATVTIKNDPIVNSNTLTNGGGANNATKAAAGGQLNFPVLFQGTSQKSTGTILWVFESSAGNFSAINSVSATCDGRVLNDLGKPTGYATTNANSKVSSFEVPALVNGAQSNCNLQIVSNANYQVSGTLLNTFYAEQNFIDANGKPAFGAFDSSIPYGNNAAKYQDTYTYNIVVQ